MLSNEIKELIRCSNKCEFKTVLLSDINNLLPKIVAQEVLIKEMLELCNKIKENKYEADKVLIYLDRYFNIIQKAKEIIK